MRWLNIAIFSLFLTACSLKSPQFSPPESVPFQGENYVIASDNRIDNLRQSLYLKANSKENPDNWQQGVLLFSEQHSAVQSLEQRAEFRRQAFAKQHGIHATVGVDKQSQELRSQVIYPPTERFHNVQLEVTRGRNSACGYSQVQFSQKQNVDKLQVDLSRFQPQLMKLALELAELPWQMECR